MRDDFNIDDIFGSDDFDPFQLKAKITEFEDRIKHEAMTEAYRFIREVGILFWIRQDMYVKHNRKIRILKKMINYFQQLEEYEKCGYLQKGVEALETNNKINNQKTKDHGKLKND